MDFKRIQLLLLIFFVIFDIYLFYLLSAKWTVNQQSMDQTTGTVNIEQQLRERNITLPTLLSTETEKLPIIKVAQNDVLDVKKNELQHQEATVKDRVLTSVFNEEIDLGVGIDDKTISLTREQANTIKQRYLTNPEYFIFGEEYTHWFYNPDERTISFRMGAYDGKAIVDGTAEIVLFLNDDFRVVSYIQTYQQNFYPLDSPLDLISEKEAMTILDQRIETNLPSDAQVLSISLSYYRSMNVSNMSIYSPAWEVVYLRRDETVRSVMVDALRGQVVSRTQITNNSQ